jgi:hypothetical protein
LLYCEEKKKVKQAVAPKPAEVKQATRPVAPITAAKAKVVCIPSSDSDSDSDAPISRGAVKLAKASAAAALHKKVLETVKRYAEEPAAKPISTRMKLIINGAWHIGEQKLRLDSLKCSS